MSTNANATPAIAQLLSQADTVKEAMLAHVRELLAQGSTHQGLSTIRGKLVAGVAEPIVQLKEPGASKYSYVALEALTVDELSSILLGWNAR